MHHGTETRKRLMIEDDPQSHTGQWQSPPVWRSLGALDVWPKDEESQVRRLLANSLPASVNSQAIRREAERSVLEAVARRQMSDLPPRVVVTCLDKDIEGGSDCDCWSFFVIERPAAPSGGGEVIELCLYRE